MLSVEESWSRGSMHITQTVGASFRVSEIISIVLISLSEANKSVVEEL